VFYNNFDNKCFGKRTNIVLTYGHRCPQVKIFQTKNGDGKLIYINGKLRSGSEFGKSNTAVTFAKNCDYTGNSINSVVNRIAVLSKFVLVRRLIIFPSVGEK